MSSRRPAARASAVRCRSSGRGRRVARRMVVDEDHARGVEPDRVAEQLADADQRRADVALVDRRDAQDVVLGVEHHDPQLLALEATHLEDQPVRDVVRTADRPACRRPVGEQPAPELEGGDQLGRLGLADARSPSASSSSVARARPVSPSWRASASEARSTAERPRVPEPHTSPISSAAVRPPTPRIASRSRGRSCDRHLPDRPAALETRHQHASMNRELAPWGVEAKADGEQERAHLKVRERPADPSNARIGVPRRRRGVPEARTTGARRFPPPSGPRGRRRA